MSRDLRGLMGLITGVSEGIEPTYHDRMVGPAHPRLDQVPKHVGPARVMSVEELMKGGGR